MVRRPPATADAPLASAWERLGRGEERLARSEERIANVEHRLAMLWEAEKATGSQVKRLRAENEKLPAAVLKLLIKTSGTDPSRRVIGIKPSGNPMTAKEAERYRDYYFRVQAGEALTEAEARDFYRLAEQAHRDHPKDKSLAIVAGIAGFALGLLVGAAAFGEDEEPKRSRRR